jgi:hypothetical protein
MLLLTLLCLYRNVWPEKTTVIPHNPHNTYLDPCGLILFPEFKLMLKEKISDDIIIITTVVEFKQRTSTDALNNGRITGRH